MSGYKYRSASSPSTLIIALISMLLMATSGCSVPIGNTQEKRIGRLFDDLRDAGIEEIEDFATNSLAEYEIEEAEYLLNQFLESEEELEIDIDGDKARVSVADVEDFVIILEKDGRMWEIDDFEIDALYDQMMHRFANMKDKYTP